MDKEIDITNLYIHPQNPREMSEFMEDKLVENILVFPKMLEARPVIMNRNNVLLRGNQRLKCLRRILDMTTDAIEEKMENQRNYRDLDDRSKRELLDYWLGWQRHPVLKVRAAYDLTPEEEIEFMIKDNIHYGEDNTAVLRDHFDCETIKDISGVAPWDIFNYDDAKINDSDIELPRVASKQFKCGYVTAPMTDKEAGELQSAFELYKAQNGDSADYFLAFLLNLDIERPEKEESDVDSEEDYIPEGEVEYDDDDNIE